VTALAPAVESFFTGYLTAQRGASPHTIASYRDTFRLLFTWIRQQAGTRPSDLDFADVDAATVSGFLAMLEDERHNTSRTRSQRLAAIHSLFRHAAPGHPEHAALIARVLAIQPRKPARETVAWLTEDEADALLAAPDTGTWTGRRDRVLMLLMLTSGPRVSEVTGLTWADVTLDRPGARVLWHGKGRKERLSPLQKPAITGLRQWHRENPAGPGSFVFTARGTARKMSTDAVRGAHQDPRRVSSRCMPRDRRQERHPACPTAFFRDEAAIRRRRRTVHRPHARPRISRINTSLPARRPRPQAEKHSTAPPRRTPGRAATRPLTSSSPSSKACETMPHYAARAPP